MLSQVTGGKRTITRRWPDRMWREASTNMPITVDMPVFWIRESDLGKSVWLDMSIIAVDDEQSPDWLSRALSAASVLLQVFKDVRDVAVPSAQDGIFPVKGNLFQQVSDELNGSDLEGALAGAETTWSASTPRPSAGGSGKQTPRRSIDLTEFAPQRSNWLVQNCTSGCIMSVTGSVEEPVP